MWVIFIFRYQFLLCEVIWQESNSESSAVFVFCQCMNYIEWIVSRSKYDKHFKGSEIEPSGVIFQNTFEIQMLLKLFWNNLVWTSFKCQTKSTHLRLNIINCCASLYLTWLASFEMSNEAFNQLPAFQQLDTTYKLYWYKLM